MASVAAMSGAGTVGDITKDLPSLQFENALTEEEVSYIDLRARSHAITVSACAQATYLAAILNEARQKVLELKSPQQSKTSKFLQDAPPRDPINVGIIGCGRMGLHLANCLLTYADVQPQELHISTRRPELLTSLQQKGVSCYYDNIKLATSVHLLFLCVLPSQLPTVATDICGRIPAHCIVYSLLSSVPIPRLRQVIKCPNIIKPEFEFRPENSHLPWDCTQDVCIALENQQQVEITCPLNLIKDESLINTKEKWAEMVLYSFVNAGLRIGLDREQIVTLVNLVILGQSEAREYEVKITSFDFTKRSDMFPIFDLTAVAANETPLTKTITQNEEIRKQFIKKYKSVFDKFFYWKGIKQIKQKEKKSD
ncbi:NADP-dependent oxidoreductase domain-containing protein 1-like [Amphiura filiformis]|uniref:NADP-dependent oxidoreductase domain-containing protein 1-like n=1 Tax=Amphiura filiformis TaxID=82378 RepID=UPI003B21701C